MSGRGTIAMSHIRDTPTGTTVPAASPSPIGDTPALTGSMLPASSIEDTLEAYAERLAAEAPPLTAAQRDRLAVVLAPTSALQGGRRG